MKPEGGSTVVGTFGYMAPEQFQGRAMPASDVYAVGATALTLLTGVEPENMPHRGLAIDVKAALRNGHTSPELVQVLTAMVEPDPDRRAARIGPLLAELDRAAPPPQGPRASHEPRRGSDAPWGHARDRRELRHEQHTLRKEMRRELEALSREGKRFERGRREQAIPAIVLLVMVLGLSIAQFSVMLALRLVVPAILMILAVIFGKGMRNAAQQVAASGKTAGETLARAKGFVQRRAVTEASARLRVDPGEEGASGVRSAGTKDSAEVEAEAELAADEEERAKGPKRRV
jgi:hypothetical protein